MMRTERICPIPGTSVRTASSRVERVAHSFTAPGDYEVKLTVSDGSGLSCGTASDTIRVKVREREAY
ncbi:PKD domain-containing protein [uncultured Roseibium sp.]|uniref:PKD domain-containing protein n=1 Tax=uncultured Roseibium sp. TaxID=1936171 RepID=UPI00374A7E09